MTNFHPQLGNREQQRRRRPRHSLALLWVLLDPFVGSMGTEKLSSNTLIIYLLLHNWPSPILAQVKRVLTHWTPTHGTEETKMPTQKQIPSNFSIVSIQATMCMLSKADLHMLGCRGNWAMVRARLYLSDLRETRNFSQGKFRGFFGPNQRHFPGSQWLSLL